jgi:tetratricopeptide (TPR) repeat protein
MEQLQFVATRDGTPASYQRLAEVQWRIGYLASARSSLAAAGRLANRPDDMRTVAKTLVEYGDPSDALTLLQRVPPGARTYLDDDEAATAEAQLEMRSAFERDFAAALKAAPPAARGVVNVHLGDARWLVGDYAAALPAYLAATPAPDVDRRHLYSLIADCQVHLNNLAAAVDAYSTAITATTDPGDEDNRAVLVLDRARAQIKLGDTGEARSALKDVAAQSNVQESLRLEAETLLKSLG